MTTAWSTKNAVEDLINYNDQSVDLVLTTIERLDFEQAEEYCIANGIIPTYIPNELELELMKRIYPQVSHKVYLEDEEEVALRTLERENYVTKGPYRYHLTQRGKMYLGPQHGVEE